MAQRRFPFREGLQLPIMIVVAKRKPARFQRFRDPAQFGAYAPPFPGGQRTLRGRER
jgi:hypothetical protein